MRRCAACRQAADGQADAAGNCRSLLCRQDPACMLAFPTTRICIGFDTEVAVYATSMFWPLSLFPLSTTLGNSMSMLCVRPAPGAAVLPLRAEAWYAVFAQ